VAFALGFKGLGLLPELWASHDLCLSWKVSTIFFCSILWRSGMWTGEGVAQLQELEEVQLRVVEALCTKEDGQQAAIVSCRRALRTILYHYNTTRVECSDAKKETLFSDCYSIDKNCCLWSNSMTTLCRENHPQLRTFVFFLPKCNFCICAN
jgi:hypothetical protein